jgi:hypothetical protein
LTSICAISVIICFHPFCSMGVSTAARDKEKGAETAPCPVQE